jgi:hypothetical protein
MNYKLDVQRKSSLDGASNHKGAIINPYDSNLYIAGNSSKPVNLNNSSTESFDCMEEEFSLWDFDEADGIVNGGSEFDLDVDAKAESQSPLLSNYGSSTVTAPNPDFVQLKLPFG